MWKPDVLPLLTEVCCMLCNLCVHHIHGYLRMLISFSMFAMKPLKLKRLSK